MHMRFTIPILAAAMISPVAYAQSAIPHDFEAGQAPFGPLFSYFGGVQSFGIEPSTNTVFSGRSLRCWANFRHDNLFRVAGVGLGTLGLDRSSGMLGFPADASIFSIAVQSPPSTAPENYVSGQLQLIITLREDDDNDGVIDVTEADDEWDSPKVLILPGTNVYNIPLSQFTDTDPFVGNNIRNFGTTGRMACLITIETRTTYPGGIIETPRSIWIDHVGLYSTNQILPAVPRPCPADFDRNGLITLQDIFDYLTAWFANTPAADFNTIGGTTLEDLFDFLSAWFAPCP